MKIWIISSWVENLVLFKFLNKFDFDYFIFLDWNHSPYQDKDFEFVKSRIEFWIKNLLKYKVDKIIVPPVFESQIKNTKIINIFENYVNNSFFKSKIWKIWILSDFHSFEMAQPILEEYSKSYSLNENQLNTKKFNIPFSFWNKQIDIWKHFLNNLSNRNWMLWKMIRYDLRYFKDCWIDTLIPFSYDFFYFEKHIKSKLNLNKIRFQWIDILQECFLKSIWNYTKSSFGLNIIANWTTKRLLDNKKFLSLLKWWKNKNIEILK